MSAPRKEKRGLCRTAFQYVELPITYHIRMGVLAHRATEGAVTRSHREHKERPMSGDVQEAKRRLPLPVLMNQLGLGEHSRKSALCPFHEDHRNSFSVFLSERGWHARWHRCSMLSAHS